ncbi:MAG: pyridoxal phosphate-dependent aminotransferase [Bacteroidia bacterium]|nr:pyridoxal phosphate-dependent aminotransferase [Bacteroidia bacterium]
MTALAESQTLAMAERVRRLKAAGKRVYSFTLGEPDFATPEIVRRAAVEAMEKGYTHYPPVAGLPELRHALSEHFRAVYGLVYSPDEIVVSTGAKQSLFNIFMALVNPGDEVVIPAPYWVSYLPMVQMAGGTPVWIRAGTEKKYKITPDDLAAAITPKTKIFLFNSPSNPTGMVYTSDEVRALAEVLERHEHVFVVSDEIYALVRFEPEYLSIGTIGALRERTMTVNGASKAFAMTGWRIGWMGAPRWICDLCVRCQGQVTSGANSVGQMAVVAALEHPDCVEPMRTAFQRRRDRAMEILRVPFLSVPCPQGAFYLYPDVSALLGKKSRDGRTIETCDDLTEYLIDRAGVAVVSGTGFGTREHIRLSYAADDTTIENGLTLMLEALAELK